MIRCVAVLLIACILSGCGIKDDFLDQALELREKIIVSDGCTFETTITADYGDMLYTFQMDCIVDSEKNVMFTVTAPETISGVTGMISKDSSELTFDDTALAFPILADDQLTPVCVPWVFVNALTSGYISGCSKEAIGFCLYIDDNIVERPLHLEVFLDETLNPYRVDLFWNQQRVISADIHNFIIQ